MQDAADETRTSAQITSLPVTSLSIDEGRFVPGTLIVGRYRIISLLGRGGMGEVYRATDLTLGQPVALKFLPNTGDGFERMLERFQNEVRVARQVSHPNVCRVYDLGEFEGMPYMSMEYVDGEDLSGLLSRIGRLPADKALDIARKICAGLAAAHDKGVIHRDLKPANIMLDKRGNAIIMDFGLAAVTNELRGAEARSGSPAYQAPEQLRGEEVTAKSDIYALGLVLYELFTGKRVYEAKSIADLIRAQEDAEFTSMSSLAADIDPTIEKAIRKCLNPVALERPASALIVSAQLPGGDPLAAALAAGETPSPELVAAAGRSEGLKLKYSAPMALVLLAFIIAVPFIRRDREIHSLTPLDVPPEALAVKIREFAAAFGYPNAPADQHYRLHYDFRAYEQVQKTTPPDARTVEDLRHWYAAESPMQLGYRESPRAMNTPDGGVSAEEPAPILSGMIEAWITSTGELRMFQAVPSQLDGVPAAAPVDVALLSKATGFDLAHMEPATPKYTPLYAFDWQGAWKGKHPRADWEAQVEAAAWHGKLTYLRVIWPGTPPGRMPSSRSPSWSQIGNILAQYSIRAIVFIIAGFLALRNLRAGRGDLKGAMRLTGIVFCLQAITWMTTAHWSVSVLMIPAMTDSLAYQLIDACMLFVLYLALEPSVRARWPTVLVSWNRILIGRWNDPLVATRVLQGACTGAVITAALLADNVVSAQHGNLSNNSYPDIGLSTRLFVADLAVVAGESIEFGLIIVFAIFLLRSLLRKDWLASVAAAVIMTVWEVIISHQVTISQAVFFLVAFTGIAFVVLRLGLVATMNVTLFMKLLMRGPGAQDLTKWYEWTVIAYPLMALILVLWAFWRASGEEALRPKPASEAT